LLRIGPSAAAAHQSSTANITHWSERGGHIPVLYSEYLLCGGGRGVGVPGKCGRLTHTHGCHGNGHETARVRERSVSHTTNALNATHITVNVIMWGKIVNLLRSGPTSWLSEQGVSYGAKHKDDNEHFIEIPWEQDYEAVRDVNNIVTHTSS
jgi:hypothetical protein